MRFTAAISLAVSLLTATAWAQVPAAQRQAETRELLERVQRLESELADLRRELAERAAEEERQRLAEAEQERRRQAEQKVAIQGAMERVSVDALIDGFYSYNFNQPEDGFNELRAYDRLDRSLGLNQAAVVIEAPTDAASGRRLGARIDLMVGQATQTLQGGPGNEPRPELYRPLFQAYGTYVAPLGKGLTVDFGKWASSLGLEGNYTQTQVNYSRSLLFNFLPFYHFGVRSRYDFDDRWGASYWLVNGDGQSEDFNRSPSHAGFLHWNPHPRLSTNWSYFGGNGNASRPATPGAGQGLHGLNLDGKFHIAYSQAVWQAARRLTLSAEASSVTFRERSVSPPQTMLGGGAMADIQLAPGWNLGARFEAVSDRGGYYSGTSQMLREGTLTLSRRLADGLLLRYEVRQDRSNRPFFLTDRPGELSSRQTTMLLGVTYWTARDGDW